MREFNLPCMQAQRRFPHVFGETWCGIAVAISSITHDWETEMRTMDADLVRAPSDRTRLKQARAIG